MKKKTILGLACASFALALGAFAGFKLSKAEVREAKAVASEGSIYIQKNDGDMKYTGSKLVGYFFDNSEPQNTHWEDAIWNTSDTYQEYTWSLDFQPTKMIMLRVDGNNWSSADPWKNIHCRTGDVTLSGADVLWMAGNANESGNWGTYSMETKVMSDSDVELGTLSSKKIKSGHEGLETFGQVSLTAGQKFYIKKTIDGAAKYNSFSSLKAIEDNISIAGDYIQVASAATYEFYFDFNGNSLYITDPVVAAADDWAQDFAENVGCKDTYDEAPAYWGDYADSYALLPDGSKDILYGATASNANNATLVSKAAFIYDMCVRKYVSCQANQFMKNSSGTARAVASSNILIPLANNSNNTAIIVIAISTISLVALGGFFFIKRKKEN